MLTGELNGVAADVVTGVLASTGTSDAGTGGFKGLEKERP